MSRNLDPRVVRDFGREWSQFDQTDLSPEELRKTFDAYFSLFPWETLPENPKGFDLGCGSGRWAKLVAPRAGELNCIDPSEGALAVAKRNLSDAANCRFHLAGVGEIPLEDGSMDFGYSLGVLHHVPDTREGIRCCVAKLKRGAPFLLYLYYAFDNRPLWFRMLWRMSDLVRRAISRSPHPVKIAACETIAALVYYPLARLALIFERLGAGVDALPLSAYRDKSFYMMRTDALDRFGTRLEQRFTRTQIDEMMSAAGLRDIRFSDQPPYWCAVGVRR